MKMTIKEHIFCIIGSIACTAAFLAVSLTMCSFMLQAFMNAGGENSLRKPLTQVRGFAIFKSRGHTTR